MQYMQGKYLVIVHYGTDNQIMMTPTFSEAIKAKAAYAEIGRKTTIAKVMPVEIVEVEA